MNLIYGEISIDSTNRIVLPKNLNLEVKEVDLIMINDDYIVILFPFESDIYIEKIYNDTSISFKDRSDVLRFFSKNCVSVDVSYYKNNGYRINLATKVISKYNLDKKIVYEIADGGRIRLWHPAKFEEYRNKIENNAVKAK